MERGGSYMAGRDSHIGKEDGHYYGVLGGFYTLILSFRTITLPTTLFWSESLVASKAARGLRPAG
jgi:hypothetical protein